MRVADYDYELPERLIAQTPLEDRSSSRLLVLHRDSGRIEHRSFTDLLDYLDPCDLLVLNDTRVSAVRIFGERTTGGKIEGLILKNVGGARYLALVRPAKKLPVGERVSFDGGLAATVVEELGGGRKVIEFSNEDHSEKLRSLGQVPLPPYIHTSLADPERYQTVYAASQGSAAAPTAGLHFTQPLLDRIAAKKIKTATVTLDVGLDTFRPVTAETPEQHVMHGEACRVPACTALAVRECTGKVVAVGTTTTRTIESFATGPGSIEHGERTSVLFITPGYRFKVVDALLTNFHMPRTTMLMMVAALAGREALMNAYVEAVGENYRFLSFGDSMLVV